MISNVILNNKKFMKIKDMMKRERITCNHLCA